MESSSTQLATWLSFIQSFLWPSVAVIFLVLFRTDLRKLVGRISSMKYGEAEFMFLQSASVDARVGAPVPESEVVSSQTERYLTESGVRKVIFESGLLSKGDEIYRTTRIFHTNSQSTWIAFTKQKVICVLDDAGTRQSGRLVQWSLPRTQATPVRARDHKPSVGLLDIGPRTHWLYSTRLYPSPEALEKDIMAAIAEGEG